MANYLKMSKKRQALALLDLGWSYRRTQREGGVRRETVSEYDGQRQAIDRDDPCWYRSGLAYRRCHLPQDHIADCRTRIARKQQAREKR